jgi:hypothetical protein
MHVLKSSRTPIESCIHAISSLVLTTIPQYVAVLYLTWDWPYLSFFILILALIEGDIVLDESTAFALVDIKSPAKRRKREIPRNTIKVWKDAVIPYVISDDMGK